MRFIQAKKFSQLVNIYKLYRKAFPLCERKPFFMILKGRSRKMADIWAIEEENSFAGLAVTINIGDMVLLDYFAVSENMRGRGVGSKALKMLQRHYSGKRFFLEIESVYGCPENVHEERQRRKKFYLSNGMSEMKIMAEVFGVEMELLGFECTATFGEYRNLYFEAYGKWVADNIKEKNIH